MAAMGGQPAPKPGSTPKPVPGAEEKDVLDDFFSSYEAPQAAVPEQESMEIAPVEDVPASPEPQSDMSPLPSPEGWASIKEQIREGATRLINSFAVTDRESIETLKSSGMFQDVRVGDTGDLEVIRPGRQGWEKLDRDGYQLITDTLDFARDAFEAVIENGIRATGGAVGGMIGSALGAPVGAAVGGVAGAPTGPGALATGTAGAVTGSALGGLLGGATGAAIGGGVGAVGALNAGDLVAEKFFEIERDPTRNKITEQGTALAMGAGFNLLSSKLARRQAEKEFRQREATKTLEFATDEMKKATQMLDEIRSSGINLDPKEGRFFLDPQQVTGGLIPDLNVTARDLSKNQGFQNFRREQGNMLSKAYETVVDAIGSASGRKSELGKDFQLTAKDIRNVEGKLIESYRAFADEKLAKQPQAAPNTLRKVKEMLSGLSEGGKLSPDSVLRAMPALTPAQAKTLIAELKDVSNSAGSGTLKIDDANRLYKHLTGVIDRTINKPTGDAYGRSLIELKNAIRDDYTQMIQAVLPPGQKEKYAKSLSRYSEIMGSFNNLNKVLASENISRNVLVEKLFEGKNSLNLARNAKTLLTESNPGMWQDLTSEFLTKLKTDHTKKITESVEEVDWQAIGKKWYKLGPEMQKEILDGSGIGEKGFSTLLNVGRMYQKTNFEALPTNTRRGVVRSVFNLLGPTLATTKGDAATSLLEGMGSNQSLMIWLKDGGMEEILKELPNLKKGHAQRLREWISGWTPRPVKRGTDLLYRGAKETGKTILRRETQKKANELTSD